MSEYQYYEFRALDRPLTAEQQRLRSLSSRAEISATRFTSEYSFGGFRGDPWAATGGVPRLLPVRGELGNAGAGVPALPRALLDAQTA